MSKRPVEGTDKFTAVWTYYTVMIGLKMQLAWVKEEVFPSKLQVS